MWTLELQTEIDGTQCLRVQTLPGTPPTEAHLMLLNLVRLLCLTEEDLECPPDMDSLSDSESNDSLSGRLNSEPWDFPNWN